MQHESLFEKKNVLGRSSLDFFASIAVEVAAAAIMTGKK